MYLNQLTVRKELPVNLLGEDYFVGDIHGEKQLLLDTLTALEFNFDTDRLIAVGDIIDRGPDSIGCLALLDEPWFHSTLGNHEEMLLKGFDNAIHWQVMLKHGGDWLKSFFNDTQKLADLATHVVDSMPLTITVATKQGIFGVSHANVAPAFHAVENTEEQRKTLLWSREIKFLTNPEAPNSKEKPAIDDIDFAIHGHNNLNYIARVNNQLCLDTLLRTNYLTIVSAQQAANFLSQ